MTVDAAPFPSLLARLRAQTGREHAALEALVPLLSETVSRADYVRFLTLVGAFHTTVEHRLAGVEGLSSVIADMPQRRKTELLARDLSALGIEPAAFLQSSSEAARGRCPLEPEAHAEVPAIASIERALGVLYVLEGSTLGAQTLQPHLSAALPETMASASRFLNCYGSRTGQMWSSFRRQVERVAPTLDADAVVDAAREAFAVLLDWFRPPNGGTKCLA